MTIIYDIIKIVVNENNKIDNNNDPTKLDKMDIQLVNTLLNSFILTKHYNVKKKYIFLKQTLDNIFIENDIKFFFMDNIQKIQKIYFAFNKFAFHYKFKKSKVIVNEDLYLNPIDDNAKNIICIYQDNSRYKFILSDLVNIINNSLSNSSYFFSEPLPCRNPFNNIPFNKSTLYNIYFKIKSYNLIIPELFHFYFLSNFNLTKFREDYEFFIRDYVIQNYVNSKDIDVLYTDVLFMLNNTNVDYYKKIKIDNGFPKKKLVKIMKPYLLLYLTSKYSLNLEKQFKSNRLLKNKLSRFFKFNPIFGRKKVDLNNVYSQEKKRMITKKTSYYVDKHISFYTNKKDDFLESHIKLQDDLEEEEDNNLPSVHEISDDDEETNSEYSESILDDDEEEINNNENQENISVINTNNISNPFLENSLFIRNYNSNIISREFSYHTDVDSALFNEIFNELYHERHYNDISNNILNNENVNAENNYSIVIDEEEEEQKDTDSIS